MKINESIIEKVRTIVKIEEILSDFITLKKKGNNLWANCPFHEEKTPSFSVSPSKGFYKCFGCDAKGDTINFLMTLENMTFLDSIQYIANKYNIHIENNTSESDLKFRIQKDNYYIINELAKEYFKDNLFKHTEGSDHCFPYLKNRGISDTLIQSFELGYSLKGWDNFMKYIQNKGFDETIIKNSGLLVYSNGEKSIKKYDRYRERLIFPIYNLYGKIIAFGGRILTKSRNEPKYINSPESLIYNKSKSLYGLYQAKREISRKNNCYLTEGYTDVLAMHKIGLKNTVASGGTSITIEQISALSRFTKTITLIFDNDNAGLEATLRGADIFLQKGFDVKIICLPIGYDPDTLIQENSKKALNFIENNTQDYITYKAKMISKHKDDPVIRSEWITNVLRSISFISDIVKQTLFIKKCSPIFGIREDFLTDEVNKFYRSQNKAMQKANRFKFSNISGIDLNKSIMIMERELIRLLLIYGDVKIDDTQNLQTFILQETEDIKFNDILAREIYEKYKEYLKKGQTLNYKDFKYSILIPSDFQNISKDHDEDTNKDIYTNNHKKLTFSSDIDLEKMDRYIIDCFVENEEISSKWEEKFGHYISTEKNNLKLTTYKCILKLKLAILRKLSIENQNNLKNNNKSISKTLYTHKYLKNEEKKITSELGIITLGI